MAGEKLNSISDFEHFIEATIKTWSPEQRVALAAAMAERWLPLYEAFSAKEQWGDPANLRRSLDAAWKHLQGRPLSASDVRRYVDQIEDSTPHMDYFDDIAALAACVMLSMALRCCVNADNIIPAIQAIISGFEAIAPDWEMDPEEQPRLWRQIRVQREFQKQHKLIGEIEAMAQFDEATIRAFRKRLRSKTYIGEPAPAAKIIIGPSTITNQTAFEIYRQLIESDLKHNTRDWWEEEGYDPGSYPWAIMLFSDWSWRYRRRGDTINPGFGSSKLTDATAQQALMALLRARDGAETALPDWGAEIQDLIDMALQNAPHGFDITAFDQPHGYGPSMRALWVKAQRSGHPRAEIWRYIVAWARHRPPAWEVEDRRKKQGLAHTSPELGVLLALELSWGRTEDLEYPWVTQVNEERWQIRLNDFPDDFMYSLVINGKGVGDFHDWPETWRRE